MIQVWYHANCYDGFGAAWAVHRAIGDAAIYVPCSYGRPPPNYSHVDDIYIVDFSFPRETLIEIKNNSNKLVVLDHHKTAEEDLKGLDFCTFDMDRSGAGMAWDYFHPNKERPRLINHIEDRDLWRFSLEGSKEVHAYLCSKPFDFIEWANVNYKLTYHCDSVYEAGETLLENKEIEVEKICKKAWLRSIAGYEVPIVNTSVHWSEVGHYLLDNYPDAKFAASFTVYEDVVMWSLRGSDGFDVSAIAKAYGGGGHAGAAGFRLTEGLYP